MTVLKYLLSTGVCNTAELIAFKKNDATGKDYASLVQMAKDQMIYLNIPIEESK